MGFRHSKTFTKEDDAGIKAILDLICPSWEVDQNGDDEELRREADFALVSACILWSKGYRRVGYGGH